MKQCPQCGTTYTDATLRYCLSDGTTLVDTNVEQATVVRPGGMRVDIGTEPQARIPTAAYGQPTNVGGTSSGSGVWKGLAAALAVLLLLGAVVVVGALIYMNSGRGIVANTNTATPTATPFQTGTPVGTPDLRDQQIANLQKQLANQQPGNTSVPPANNVPSGARNVRVNSPGDGFLALRSQPSTDSGERITKIPHGATITIGACRGHWCRAVYNGYAGWIYDTYVIY